MIVVFYRSEFFCYTNHCRCQLYCKGADSPVKLQRAAIFFSLPCPAQQTEYVRYPISVRDEADYMSKLPRATHWDETRALTNNSTHSDVSAPFSLLCKKRSTFTLEGDTSPQRVLIFHNRPSCTLLGAFSNTVVVGYGGVPCLWLAFPGMTLEEAKLVLSWKWAGLVDSDSFDRGCQLCVRPTFILFYVVWVYLFRGEKWQQE